MEKIKIENSLIMAEVSSDYNLMITQQANLSDEYTYGKMSKIEFLENRKNHMYAGIPTWLYPDTDASYLGIIVARICKKTGYATTASDITYFLDAEEQKSIRETINSTITMMLKNDGINKKS